MKKLLKKFKHQSFNEFVEKYDKAVGTDASFSTQPLEKKRQILREYSPENRTDINIENWLRANCTQDFEQEEQNPC